ncbi:MAG: lamin tail domain-containing protein [Bacteroidetes bacterium]|nr:lamin tail domain-containing protein [Bacteroidota bacterium]
MKKLFFTCFCCFCLLSLQAQITEDFNDGDWTNGVSWNASSADWAVENAVLRSANTTDQAEFQIFTSSTRIKNTQWMLWLNLKFNTSSANYVDLFLAADSAPSKAKNGYYVRIGNTKDEVSLYRLLNGTATEIISGADGLLNTSDNTLRIRITCSSNYLWNLEYTSGASIIFLSSGTVVDSAVRKSQWTGLRVKQSTASFHKRHYFDDFYCGDPILDLTPPTITNARFTAANLVKLDFSEPLRSLLPADSMLFNMVGFGRPDDINTAADGLSATLRFPALSGKVQTYTLQASGFMDLAGNPNTGQRFDFLGGIPAAPRPGTLIITELMPDPDPVVASLPAAEYVELQNTSNDYVSLRGVRFSDPSSSVALPDSLLGPGQRIILCEASQANLYKTYGRVLGLSPWPSLNNSGDQLYLRDAGGFWLHEVKYDAGTYGNTAKSSGGWSLEMVDPQNPCDPSNWKASRSPQGGTPGAQNSVNGSNPDKRNPQLAEVYPEDPFLLRIRLNELPDSGTLKPGRFRVGNDTALAVYAGTDRAEYKLGFLNPFQKGTLYKLTAEAVADCAGNLMQRRDYPFMLPEHQPDSGELVINEVLFDPYVGGEDFVELYNRGSRCLDLRDLRLANASPDFISGEVLPLSDRGRMLLPGQFVALSANTNFLKQRYPRNGGDSALYVVAQLPAYPNDEGAVMLFTASGKELDRMAYRDNQHFSLINDREGVSLERIRTDVSGAESGNWQSAAQEAGWATPGLPNSQAEAGFAADGVFQTDRPYFSPDMDGFEDVLSLLYRFNSPGYVLSVTVYDEEGKTVRRLSRNLYAGISGVVKWDGIRDDGARAAVGNYILHAEAFSDRGQLVSKKLLVALLLRN